MTYLLTLFVGYLLWTRHISKLLGSGTEQDRQVLCSYKAYLLSGNRKTNTCAMENTELNNFNYLSFAFV